MKPKDLPNFQLATLAVALLGGADSPVHSEDVALKVSELVPGRFSWVKYPQYVNLASVRASLWDAKKVAKGSFILGNNDAGWVLSPTGIEWLTTTTIDDDNVQAQLKSVDLEKVATANATSSSRERRRMRNTEAFALFSAGEQETIDLQKFYAFAKVNEYFGEKSRGRRFNYIETVVAGDNELLALWSFLKKKFTEDPNEK